MNTQDKTNQKASAPETRKLSMGERYADVVAQAEAERKGGADWQRVAIQLKGNLDEARAHAEQLAAALRDLLAKIDNITSNQFALGAEKQEREQARAALAAWKGAQS